MMRVLSFKRFHEMVGLLACLAWTGAVPAQTAAPAGEFLVYVGTYTGAKSKGIYVCRLEAATGKLTAPALAAETVNPTFLAVHPNQRFLYAANETGGGGKSGTVSAYRIEAPSGQLTLLNQQASGGGGPCHLAVDGGGKNVLVANYGGGSVAVLPLKEDGSLAAASAVVQHRGSSVNPKRQAGPHAHWINLDAANRFAFVCDLGLDKVLIYQFDPVAGALAAHEPAFAAVKPGAGPRHLAFHPAGRFAYVINELDSTITAFSYEAARGILKEFQTLSTLPAGFTGASTTAEIECHPTGNFLYGSNRGHDSVAVFAVEARTGKLTFVEHVSTQGKSPRHFALDPTGRYLLAANQGSDTVFMYRLDPQTGRLTPTGERLEIGAPVCLKFVPVK